MGRERGHGTLIIESVGMLIEQLESRCGTVQCHKTLGLGNQVVHVVGVQGPRLGVLLEGRLEIVSLLQDHSLQIDQIGGGKPDAPGGVQHPLCRRGLAEFQVGSCQQRIGIHLVGIQGERFGDCAHGILKQTRLVLLFGELAFDSAPYLVPPLPALLPGIGMR